MRINKFMALATGISRRAADTAISADRVQVNGQAAQLGQAVSEADQVTLDGKHLTLETTAKTTIVLNKPVGYVVSRDGQGNHTVYDLLPRLYRQLKPVGRLDKDSSGLLLLTNDGQLAHSLTHPSQLKQKVYEVTLKQPLQPLHRQMISNYGIKLEDGLSNFELERLADGDDTRWRVRMHQGRNRQIRRTFAALGYTVTRLHRTHFGPYRLNDLTTGAYTVAAQQALLDDQRLTIRRPNDGMYNSSTHRYYTR